MTQTDPIAEARRLLQEIYTWEDFDDNICLDAQGTNRTWNDRRKAWLASNPESKPAAGVAEAWRDDPTADERWNAGCDFAMQQLCAWMGVDPQSVSWDAATETVEGDVSAVIGNIMRTKMGEDWSPEAALASAAPANMRETGNG